MTENEAAAIRTTDGGDMQEELGMVDQRIANEICRIPFLDASKLDMKLR